jgi:hypothetical protein
MMIRYNIIGVILSIILCSGCSNEQMDLGSTSKKEPLINWVTGNYTLNSDYGKYYENWEKQDSVTYLGLGYFMDAENEDTLFRQRMRLHQTDKGVVMYYHVKNQNDNKIVEFSLTKQENNIFTFENSFRDYPSIVTYKILSDTSINVVMNGFKNGAEKSEDFIITKKP